MIAILLTALVFIMKIRRILPLMAWIGAGAYCIYCGVPPVAVGIAGLIKIIRSV